MIQSTLQLEYDNRTGEGLGIIHIEIVSMTDTFKGVTTFEIEDFIINENSEKVVVGQKTRNRTDLEIDAISQYISDNYDLSTLTRSERNRKEMQIGLLLETMQNPLYKSLSNQWKISE
jgi:hypothetical protein